MEQKIIVCKFHELETKVNQSLREGWLVKIMVGEPVSVAGESYNAIAGRVCVVLERSVSRDDTGPM